MDLRPPLTESKTQTNFVIDRQGLKDFEETEAGSIVKGKEVELRRETGTSKKRKTMMFISQGRQNIIVL
jgi:hypothetical protein